MAKEEKSEEVAPKEVAPKAVAPKKKAKAPKAGLSDADKKSLNKLAKDLIPTLKGSIVNAENEKSKHQYKEPAVRQRHYEQIEKHVSARKEHIEFLEKFL